MWTHAYFVTSTVVNDDEFLSSFFDKRDDMLKNVKWDQLSIQQISLISYHLEGITNTRRLMASHDKNYIKNSYD